MTRVLFTGGGTAGHVTPNIALLEASKGNHWDVAYVGSQEGIEREMIGELDIPYFAIASGKLRRYFSWQNFIDPFLILWGILQSLVVCWRWKPNVVFSKGGFVSVPLVIAAWLLRVPVISHESDVTPGLANRLTFRFCKTICVTFEATRNYLPVGKVIVTGTPIRQALLKANAEAGLTYLGFTGDRPVLLVFGGSLGATTINSQVRQVVLTLVQHFDVIHVVGRGNLDTSFKEPRYVQREFIGEEFGDVLAASTLVVSRAGANSIYELLMAGKPHLLIPLSKAASRGDQLDNARVFADLGFSDVLYEEELSDAAFLDSVMGLFSRKDDVKDKLSTFERKDSVSLIIDLLQASV